MAPFDCDFAGDHCATVDLSDVSASVVGSRMAPPWSEPVDQIALPKAYPLTNEPARAAVLEDGIYASSMRTNSYAEYLLQTLDANATMSSVAFILLYAGLLHFL